MLPATPLLSSDFFRLRNGPPYLVAEFDMPYACESVWCQGVPLTSDYTDGQVREEELLGLGAVMAA